MESYSEPELKNKVRLALDLLSPSAKEQWRIARAGRIATTPTAFMSHSDWLTQLASIAWDSHLLQQLEEQNLSGENGFKNTELDSTLSQMREKIIKHTDSQKNLAGVARYYAYRFPQATKISMTSWFQARKNYYGQLSTMEQDNEK